MAEPNHHFKALVSGAPPEILAALGEAFLALRDQRAGAEVDCAPALRQASLELLRWLLRERLAAPTPQQMLFLASGALAGGVTLKDRSGQPVNIELLPDPLYELLLAETAEAAPADGIAHSLIFPRQRWADLASGLLSPFDFNRPGRFKPHQSGQPRGKQAQAGVDERPPSAHAVGGAEWDALLAELKAGQQEVAGLLRQFAGAVSGERLGGLLREITAYTQFVGAATEQLIDPQRRAQLVLPSPERQPALVAVEHIHAELHASLSALAGVQRKQLAALDRLQQLAGQASAEPQPSPAPVAGRAAPADQLKLIESDAGSMFAAVSQYLINHPQRTPWSASRVLLAEHFEKIGAPPEDCVATPVRLLAAVQRAQALHPNCFPLDDRGEPVLPPVIVEPGVGLAKWLDDRFLLSFVATDVPRPGPQLSFSPLDQAVLRLFGSFLARGDIWNYRGERLQDNFMAEYAGEVEQKVAVKFAGADKKLTYGTSAEEKDGASREDAVRDYLDFVFCVFNGQQLPKRITPRKAGVFLKYCVFRDPAFTVSLTLHLIAGADALAARAIILRHVHHDPRKVLQLCQQALEGSPALQTRYRRDLPGMLHTVMGREFMDDARDAGLLAAGAGKAEALSAEAESPETGQRDYFDL